MKINEVQDRSVLTKSNLPASDYCINPYLGCAHGCVYCYAKFLGRWRGHKEKWGEYVDIRVNAPEILAREFQRRKPRPKGTVLIGSMTDAYQPLEKKYRLTRKILSVLFKNDFPVSILTKSDLVLRDLDIISRADSCEVGVTIITLNEKFRKKTEPETSSIKKRLETLQTLKKAGITTYAFIGPIFPYLTDYAGILKEVAGHVDFVIGETLNIKGGSWQEVEPVLSDFGIENTSDYRRTVNDSTFWDSVSEEFEEICQRFGIRLAAFLSHGRTKKLLK